MSESKVFGREEILAAKEKRNVIKLDNVPGLGGSVYIREMKRGEFSAWIQRIGEEDSKLVASVLCDEAGALLFDENNPEDMKAIEDSFTTKGLAFIGMKAISENSASPQVVEKNLQASLNIALSSDSPRTTAAPLAN